LSSLAVKSLELFLNFKELQFRKTHFEILAIASWFS
jgi:hypothetical protein